MQFLADICDVEVSRPAFQEVTALGAAKLAAHGAGVRLSKGESAAARTWSPRLGADETRRLREGWRTAVEAALAAARPSSAVAREGASA
jgi:glycerol kinase